MSATNLRSREHALVVLAAVLGSATLVLAAVFLSPDPRGFGTHEQLGFERCYAIDEWNVPCPGCGITTSVVHALHGELGASLSTQPFGLLIVATWLGFSLWAVGAHFRGRDTFAALRRVSWRRVGAVGALLLLAAWIYKVQVHRASI